MKNSSLKAKLISGFVIVILLMGSINILPFIVLNVNMGKMESMVNTTVVANEIVDIANNTTPIINNFMTDKSDNERKNIENNLSKLSRDISVLKKNVNDKNGQDSLDSMEKIIQTFSGNAKNAVKLNDGKNYDKAMKSKESAESDVDTLKNSSNDFISTELNYYKSLKDQVDDSQKHAAVIMVSLIVIIAILTMICSIVFSNGIANAILGLSKNAMSIADGNLKVKDVKVKSKDDIFVLAKSFNKMCDTLRSVIKRIAESSKKVANSADTLKINVEQNSMALEQVSGSIQKVSEGAHAQSEQCKMTVEAINQLYDGNKRIQENVNSALETSKLANEAADSGSYKMNALVSQIEAIKNKISDAQSTTEFLKTRTDDVEKILDVINDISTQTNLLALNASIEAARVGEQGRGFAVVANEIKKLSNQSENSSKEISAILKDIKLRVQNVASKMTESVEGVAEGTNLAVEAGGSFKNIVSTISNVDTQIKNITGQVDKMVESIKNVESMSKNIYDISNKTSLGSNDVAASVEEQTASIQEISSYTDVLSSMSQELESIVKQFKI